MYTRGDFKYILFLKKFELISPLDKLGARKSFREFVSWRMERRCLSVEASAQAGEPYRSKTV